MLIRVSEEALAAQVLALSVRIETRVHCCWKSHWHSALIGTVADNSKISTYRCCILNYKLSNYEVSSHEVSNYIDLHFQRC